MVMALGVPHYTVDDLDKFPHDGNRYELLDGVLLVTPAPSLSHQTIASRLQLRLSNAVMLPGQANLALGLRKVWLIDLFDRSVEVCRAVRESEIVRDVLRWWVPGNDTPVAIELDEVFADL